MRTTLVALLSALGVLGCTSAQSTSMTAMPDVQGEIHAQSGIRFIELAQGSGTPVAQRKCLYVHYTGWLSNGKMFDSSHEPSTAGTPGEPVVVPLGTGAVMRGWEVGFQGMSVGGRRRLFIPYDLAYGEKGNPPVIPARSSLIFDVELMAVADRMVNSASPQCPTWRAVSRT